MPNLSFKGLLFLITFSTIALYLFDALGIAGTQKTFIIENLITNEKSYLVGQKTGIFYDKRNPQERKFNKLLRHRTEIQANEFIKKFRITVLTLSYNRRIYSKKVEFLYDPRGILFYKGKEKKYFFELKSVTEFNKILMSITQNLDLRSS